MIVIEYGLDSCNHCLKCIKVCPTEAIKIVDNKVVIDDNKCIFAINVFIHVIKVD